MNTPEPDSSTGNKRMVPVVCLVLAAMTWLVFGQTCRFEFVNYDDNLYVFNNAKVAGGLTLNGIVAMFTHVECNFYHPLTMISLMLNYQLHGLQPGGYHLANVLLHTLSAILLFLTLRRMTGFTWRSAFVAAVFAIHPLRVESVAWVAERKDVLSGFFFMLTLWAYARYAQNTRSPVRYLAVVFFFALGLLCKSSVVTLPFVLLLLDFWPLRRFEDETPVGGKSAVQRVNFSVLVRLLGEKIPLFVLSAAAAVMTVVAEGKAISSTNQLPFLTRVGNPLMSYATYLRQMVCPADLAPFYPFPTGNLPGWKIVLALVLLVAISAAAFMAWRKHPYLLVGWSWYLGMLVPMIGIMQVGQFAHADRFTYLPQIGLYLLLTWSAADLCAGWRHRRVVLGGCSTIILIALIVCACAQTSYWRNSESLWKHTIACTPANVIAHSNLGVALAAQHRFGEAVQQYQQAIEINPEVAETYRNLAAAFTEQGRLDEAVQCYQKAIEKRPDYAEAHNNLGIILAQQGRPDEAIGHLQKALAIKPDYAEADNNLGIVFASQSRFDEAIVTFQKALSIKPDYADAHYNLANVFAVQGRKEKALQQYKEALRLNPANDPARQQIRVLSSNH
jgi:Tfp pilus assembly protein PilF